MKSFLTKKNLITDNHHKDFTTLIKKITNLWMKLGQSSSLITNTLVFIPHPIYI